MTRSATPLLLVLGAATLACSACAAPRAATSEPTVYFKSDFNTPGPNGYYSFEWAWPEKDQNFVRTHLPTGGWDGSGAGHLLLRAGKTQYNLGWNVSPLKRTFKMGDSLFIRFRIRYDDDTRWVGRGSVENKLILIGQTRTSPNSRIIVHAHGPGESRGCTLGMRDWSHPQSPVYKWASPSHFGLRDPGGQYPWDNAGHAGQYGSIAPHVNISWFCAPPALVTYGNHPNPPVPGPNSAAPVNGWYHVQIQATSGEAGKGAFRLWVNNNTLDKPTSQQIGLEEGLGVTGWGDAQIFVGGYMSEEPAKEIGFRLDDFELGSAFEPAWAPAAPPKR